MNKIKFSFSNDHNFLLYALRIITYALSIFTIVTFIATIIDIINHNSLTYPSALGIKTFLLAHEKFCPLYASTVSVVIAYIAVKQYLHSNTLQTLDFFYEKLIPTANETINCAKEKLSSEITFPNLNNEIDFTSEELKKLNPELYDEIYKLHTTDLEFQTKAILTLGYFESFSIKITNGLIKHELIEKASSKAFCIQVRNLYPLISITRQENNKSYFTTLVSLFNKWKHVL